MLRIQLKYQKITFIIAQGRVCFWTNIILVHNARYFRVDFILKLNL